MTKEETLKARLGNLDYELCPEHILENILTAMDDYSADLQKTVAEQGREIERLKGLLETAHTSGWIDGVDEDGKDLHGSWQQFKKDNSL